MSFRAGGHAGLALSMLLACQAAAPAATPVTRAALPPAATSGRGADTPFVTYEAEDGETNGAVIGPSRKLHDLASEASGRRAVRLEGTEQYVELELARPADGLTVRYAIPDSPDGSGLDAALLVSVGGKPIATIPVTSRYSWFYGRYPFTNAPRDGGPRRFYDHARIHLGRMLAPGSRLRLSLAPGSAAQWVAIDLVDAEQVPPPSKAPPHAISVTDFGADPAGKASSAAAFDRAIALGTATGRTVWIPPGIYRIDRHLIVDRVRIAGAGYWHSILRGSGVGIYGRRPPRVSSSVELSGFAIVGDVRRREDRKPLAAIGGAFSRSTMRGLWLQHTKVGVWIDGPADRLLLSDLRILDQAADGVNFHGGVTNSVVRNSFVRGSGDDGLAMWSHRRENAGNRFENNSVIAPFLANGIALYGGRDLSVTGNLVADSVTQGGGIHIGSRFKATPFAGTIAIRSNSVVRSGDLDPNWKFGVGALWIHALDHPISARIEIADLALIDSRCAAIQFIGKRIDGVSLERVVVTGTAAHVVQIQASGSASFRNAQAQASRVDPIVTDGSSFAVIDAGGNGPWIAKRAERLGPDSCPAE